MFQLKKELIPGTVIWANRNIYYDEPDRPLYGKSSMYLITMLNSDYFFGCPLSISNSTKNRTVLHKKYYPIKYNSKIKECIYRLSYEDIVSPKKFQISEGTFEHFKRKLYKKIILGYVDSPKEYNDIFIEEYLKEHQPAIGSILVYPTEEKVFKYYYICDMDQDTYSVLPLVNKKHIYSLISDKKETISKNIKFFDYFQNFKLEKSTKERLMTLTKTSNLGSSYNKK